MAVFTAIATAIVTGVVGAGTILGSVTLFNVAVGVVAAGLAVGTAKLLGVFEAPGNAASRDPGVKIQLPPATDNKVPKLYGRNYTGGIITDVEIKRQNKTMAYCLVLGEYADGETWTINNIYRGDSRMVFGGGGVDPWIVTNQIDPNSTANEDISGKLRFRVYAGGSDVNSQIFPTTLPANAYAAPGTDGFCQFRNWTAANTMDGLIFAVIEIDYDAENGLTGLGAITFDLESDVTNPADVLEDYMTNTRYGAGLTTDEYDVNSVAAWRAHCDTLVPTDGGGTEPRYRLNGAFSTFNDVKTNINKIMLSGAGWFTYNNKDGKFGVTVNRAATQAEKDAAYQITDDNVVDAINLTGTELYSLYNQVEIEYPSVIKRDQTDVYYGEVGAGVRHPNEPDNVLKYRFDMVNSRGQVARLANIDLNQSRVSSILDTRLDHSAISIDVGDVVKWTSDLYGYEDKLYRVMRTVEEETAEGVISIKTTMLEYDDDVYGDIITADELPDPPNGVPNFWNENGNSLPQFGNIAVACDPRTFRGTLVTEVGQVKEYSAAGTLLGNVDYDVYTDGLGTPLTNTVFVNVEATPAANTTFDTVEVIITDADNANVEPYVWRNSAARYSDAYFTPEESYNVVIDTFALSNFEDSNVTFGLKFIDSVTGSASRTNTSSTIPLCKRQNVVDNPSLTPGAAAEMWFADHAALTRSGADISTPIIVDQKLLTVTEVSAPSDGTPGSFYMEYINNGLSGLVQPSYDWIIEAYVAVIYPVGTDARPFYTSEGLYELDVDPEPPPGSRWGIPYYETGLNHIIFYNGGRTIEIDVPDSPASIISSSPFNLYTGAEQVLFYARSEDNIVDVSFNGLRGPGAGVWKLFSFKAGDFMLQSDVAYPTPLIIP